MPPPAAYSLPPLHGHACCFPPFLSRGDFRLPLKPRGAPISLPPLPPPPCFQVCACHNKAPPHAELAPALIGPALPPPRRRAGSVPGGRRAPRVRRPTRCRPGRPPVKVLIQRDANATPIEPRGLTVAALVRCGGSLGRSCSQAGPPPRHSAPSTGVWACTCAARPVSANSTLTRPLLRSGSAGRAGKLERRSSASVSLIGYDASGTDCACHALFEVAGEHACMLPTTRALAASCLWRDTLSVQETA